MATPSLESIEALFDAERFAECRSQCQALLLLGAAVEEPVAKRVRQIQRKCDLNLASSTTAAPAAASTADAAAPAPVVPPTPVAVAAAPAAPAASAAPPTLPPAVLAARMRFEWFQSPDTVTLTFYVKDRRSEDVTVDVTATSLDVQILLGEGRDYQYSVERLFSSVDPASLQRTVKSMKVELVLRKVSPGHWPTLELKDGDVVAAHCPTPAAAGAAPSQRDLPYPNSKGKDWSKFKLSEEEEKLTGDEGLNAFFKDIYGKGSDETRKAMMKSFQESGGTVLSTNWKDVGSKTVVGEAPKGMVMKSWTKEDE